MERVVAVWPGVRRAAAVWPGVQRVVVEWPMTRKVVVRPVLRQPLGEGVVGWWDLSETLWGYGGEWQWWFAEPTGTFGVNGVTFTGQQTLALASGGVFPPVGGAFCVAMWVNLPNLTGTQVVLGTWGGITSNHAWAVMKVNGQLRFYVRGAASYVASGTAVVGNNFVCATYSDLTRQMVLRVNGATATVTHAAPSMQRSATRPLMLGGETDYGARFVGAIRSVGIWNRSLTVQEQNFLASGPKSWPDVSLWLG